MTAILYLAHRLPYPPNKGDKVRSFHFLEYLASRYEVYLGTFVDDPADEAHVATVEALCAAVHVARLDPRVARLRSLSGFATGGPLTLPYYRNARLAAWCEQTVKSAGISTAVVFSSAMAQFVPRSSSLRMLVDFVDVDSAKWTQYGAGAKWPMSWIFQREGRRLLAAERDIARRAHRSFFVTEAEANIFRALAPEAVTSVRVINNGVDAAYFSPAQPLPSPYPEHEQPIVFTGAMNYRPNVDAALWFAREVLPLIRQERPQARFYVVGMNPDPAVVALNGRDVVVTGTVPDVRPYVRHAPAVVAPLRIARGIQNKILEAMAMARPVVASRTCASGIEAEPGRQLLLAETSQEFSSAVLDLLRDRSKGEALGRAARAGVVSRYDWRRNVAAIDEWIVPGQSVAPDRLRPAMMAAS